MARLVQPVTLNIETWIQAATKKYPQIESIFLTGSRARGLHTEYSDIDLIIYLGNDCYDADNMQIDGIEERIVFDSALRSEALDVFFMRPNSTLGRWETLENRAALLKDADPYTEVCIKYGVPMGDFSRLFESLDFAKCLYHK